MKTILLYLLESLACSAMFAAYYRCFLRDCKFHGFNRAYLLLSSVASPVIPLLHVTYSVEVPVPVPPRVEMSAGSATLDPSALADFPVSSYADYAAMISVVAYLLPALYLLSVALRELLRIRFAKRNAPTVKIEGTDVCTIDSDEAPFAFFNTIFWKSSMDIDSPVGRRIFRHELAHVRAGHGYDKLLMQLLCALFWMNPVLRLLKRELELVHEYVADSACVAGNDAGELSALILYSLYPESFRGLTSHFFQSNIKKRIVMLSKRKKSRFSWCRRLMMIPVGLLALYLFAVETEAKYVAVSRDSENGEDTTATATDRVNYNAGDSFSLSLDMSESSATQAGGGDTADSVRIGGKNTRISNITTFTDSDLKIIKQLFRSKGKDDAPLIIVERDEGHKEGEAESLESLSILKGVAAVGTYGEKGKNGVIIIKTTNKLSKEERKRSEEARKRGEEARKRGEEARRRGEEARRRSGTATSSSKNETGKRNEAAIKQLSDLRDAELKRQEEIRKQMALLEQMILKEKNNNRTEETDAMQKSYELIEKALEESRTKHLEELKKLQEELNDAK